MPPNNIHILNEFLVIKQKDSKETRTSNILHQKEFKFSKVTIKTKYPSFSILCDPLIIGGGGALRAFFKVTENPQINMIH